jgi:hypothetical protein
MPQIRIYIDGDTEQPTPTPTPEPEPPADLQSEIDRINAALCDVLTRIAKIEGNVHGLRLRLIEQDAEGQVP